MGSDVITTITTARVVVGSPARQDEVGVGVAIEVWLRLVHLSFVVNNGLRLQTQLLTN